MPSVTDVQQQQQSSSTATHGKATPPPQQQSSSAAATTAAAGDADPLTQAILLLDKKQRNLGKRKEKLETYQQEAKTGKELHKDQTEALAKYPEVLGQIECVKELSEQLKKLQVESARNQKRLSKQAADEKRQLVSQRLREYARLRYLLDHRPATLKPEDGKLLDELAAVITPTENSLASISRSIDTVLGIYQANTSSAPIKHLPGRSAQEVRDALEQLLQSSEPQALPTPTPTPTPAPAVSAPEPVPVKAAEETNDVQPTSDDETSNKPTQLSEYPFQLDTRTQDISVEQIIQNSQFLSNDSPTPSQDNDNEQALDQNQYLQPFTVVNSNQQTSPAAAEHPHAGNAAHPVDTHDQHAEGQWQQPRGNVQRGGQYIEGNGSRSFHRGRPNHYNQAYRGPRGGGYENAYGSGGGGQRPYHENNRGRGGPNPNYRGNRGGNYRGGNRGYYNNSNNGEGYHNAGQHQQVRSAPPSSTQHQ